MTEFQDWQIPLQFSDALEEYHAVRTAAGLFDISYLGRIEVSGADAAQLASERAHPQHVEDRRAAPLTTVSSATNPGSSSTMSSSFACRKPPHLLTTNAGNTEKILLWLKKHAADDVQ